MKFTRLSFAAVIAATVLGSMTVSVTAGTAQTPVTSAQASKLDRNDILFRKVRAPVCAPCPDNQAPPPGQSEEIGIICCPPF